MPDKLKPWLKAIEQDRKSHIGVPDPHVSGVHVQVFCWSPNDWGKACRIATACTPSVFSTEGLSRLLIVTRSRSAELKATHAWRCCVHCLRRSSSLGLLILFQHQVSSSSSDDCSISSSLPESISGMGPSLSLLSMPNTEMALAPSNPGKKALGCCSC